MKEILLGIDIGTSSCKVAAFDLSGNVIAQASECYKVYYPQSGYAEQNPDDWWSAVCRATKKITENSVDMGSIAGVGIDGQSWSAVAIDKQGKVLTNTPIWMDTRASDICSELRERIGEDILFETSGNPLEPMYTMPKVLWYKKHLPSVYESTYKILNSNSFIAYRLTGVCSQDKSQGYGWSCYDMKKGEWNLSLCDKTGIKPELLPKIYECHEVIGEITSAAAAQIGLMPGTPVVAGGLDAACGTLGAGVIFPGETQEQGGQAGGMSICMDEVKADRRLILSAHVVPSRWLLQGGTVGGSGALNWFEREFCLRERVLGAQNGTNSFVQIDAVAKEIPPACDGLTFLPYLAGERSPIWDKSAQGVFFGVTFSKTRAHFARSVMEGVAYSLRHNLETAEAAGAKIDKLCAMGGAANSPLWMQIKADVTGKEIVVPSSDTATAFGAAILAGVGVGAFKSFEAAVEGTVKIKKSYTPDETNKKSYDKAYKIYRELYESLKGLMKESDC